MADETKPAPKPAPAPVPAPARAPEAAKPADAAPPTAQEVKSVKDSHDKLIADAMESERKASPAREGQKANFGPFADHPKKFRVMHEAVGRHARNEVVTYRDLMIFNGAKGGGADYQSPNVTQTKSNVDRLIALGAIVEMREDD